jgi:hypothetical protein
MAGMLAALDTQPKISALAFAMVLTYALIRTGMEYLLPFRFRLKSMLLVTAFLAVVFALLGYAFS